MIDLFYLYKVFMRMNEGRYSGESSYAFDPMEDFCNWISTYFYDIPQYQSVKDVALGPHAYDMLLDMMFIFMKGTRKRD